jgi:hypothetical protein
VHRSPNGVVRRRHTSSGHSLPGTFSNHFWICRLPPVIKRKADAPAWVKVTFYCVGPVADCPSRIYGDHVYTVLFRGCTSPRGRILSAPVRLPNKVTAQIPACQVWREGHGSCDCLSLSTCDSQMAIIQQCQQFCPLSCLWKVSWTRREVNVAVPSC